METNNSRREITPEETIWQTCCLMLISQGQDVNEAMLCADLVLDGFRKIHTDADAE